MTDSSVKEFQRSGFQTARIPDSDLAFNSDFSSFEEIPAALSLVLRVSNLSKSDSLKQAETLELSEIKQKVAHRPAFPFSALKHEFSSYLL